MKLRLQPIRVFCMHHVCAEFDAESMNRSDWVQVDEFKRKVSAMRQNGLNFISLTDAYNKIANDKFRYRKYAVLTFDDGYTSLKEILPWLEEQNIPATLFINGKYLDGKSYRKNPKERYLTQDELYALTSPLLAIASHGWEHIDVSQMSKKEFEEYIGKNIQILVSHPCYIPFHAYTWGKHTKETDGILFFKDMIPVYIDGMKNFNNPFAIHRELFDL